MIVRCMIPACKTRHSGSDCFRFLTDILHTHTHKVQKFLYGQKLCICDIFSQALHNCFDLVDMRVLHAGG